MKILFDLGGTLRPGYVPNYPKKNFKPLKDLYNFLVCHGIEVYICTHVPKTRTKEQVKQDLEKNDLLFPNEIYLTSGEDWEAKKTAELEEKIRAEIEAKYAAQAEKRSSVTPSLNSKASSSNNRVEPQTLSDLLGGR